MSTWSHLEYGKKWKIQSSGFPHRCSIDDNKCFGQSECWSIRHGVHNCAHQTWILEAEPCGLQQRLHSAAQGKPWWLDADTTKIKKTCISYTCTSCSAVSNFMANLRNLMLYVFKHKDKSISLCSIQCALRVHVIVVDSNDLFSLEQKHICEQMSKYCIAGGKSWTISMTYFDRHEKNNMAMRVLPISQQRTSNKKTTRYARPIASSQYQWIEMYMHWIEDNNL
jgi:hypothetical protein